MSFFKTHYPPYVCTATSTGLEAAVTPPSTTGVMVPTQTPSGSGDEEATLSRYTSDSSAASADRVPPTKTDGTWSTDDGPPAGSTSSTDSTMERVTIEGDSEALSSPSITVDVPATILSTSFGNDALMAPPASVRKLDVAQRQGKQPSSLNSKQPWSKRPHFQNRVGKMAKSNAECHFPHEYIYGSDFPSPIHPGIEAYTTGSNWKSKRDIALPGST